LPSLVQIVQELYSWPKLLGIFSANTGGF